MNEQPKAARRRRTQGGKISPKDARRLMIGGGALLFAVISLFGWLLSDVADPDGEDASEAFAAVSAAPSEEPAIWIVSSSEAESAPESEPAESEPEIESKPEPTPESKPEEPPVSSSVAPASSAPAAPSESPAPLATASSEPAASSTPAASSSAPPPVSSSEEPQGDPSIIDLSELEQPEEQPPEQPEEPEEPRSNSTGSKSKPQAHPDVADEILYYSSGGTKKKLNAYDLICGAVQNETNGLLAPEALKAHVVATYTMIQYNNERGLAPWVVLKTPISASTKQAVDEVLGQAVYYNGSYANTVYHSTSSGETTSSESVWGGALPYLVSVESPYDKKAPGYATISSVSRANFEKRVRQVYGIELDGDPEDWIIAERDAPGGYVGTVEIGGYTRSQGGSYGTGAITGRSVREQLLSFGIRSHCFEVEYNADKDQFEFTTYGYGHGVGMSQYGAHFMAQDGYDYIDILEHYYTGVTVE